MTKEQKQTREEIPGMGREAQELRALWDISQSLYQYLNIDDLILHIIKRTKELMDAEGGSVILHDEETDEFVFCWAEIEPSESVTKLAETRFPVHQGIAGRVFKSGKPELIGDIAGDPDHYKAIDDITGFQSRSMIAVPLHKREKTIGVLELLNKSDGRFEEGDLTFLSTLAPIIAMALDNARMYTALGRAYNELQLIDKTKDNLIKDTKEENARLRREIERHYRFDQIIGNSDRMLEVLRLCERAIESGITVLIEGETGTGKELIARCIHYNSPRKEKAFVTQNCGGIPDTLLASELFGHTKGAFTGAYKDKKGLFEVANGGTLFLDEVAEMSPAMQASLLRVLQEGEVKPLGSDYSKKVDVRVISATNKNLEDETKDGKFREDLLYRLNVFTIKLPPLRERAEDIPILANHFITKFSEKTTKSVKGLSPEAMRYLSGYPFPGNLRELENEINRAIAMGEDGKPIEVRHLSKKIQDTRVAPSYGLELKGTLKQMVESFEISVLTEMFEKHGGNKTKVAKELGLSRYGLLKKMQRYGL